METRALFDPDPRVPPRAEKAATIVLDAAFEIHRTLGPGLLEDHYQQCMAIELRTRGVEFLQKPRFKVEYKGHVLEGWKELDFIVDDALVVELKSAEGFHPSHFAQTLTYLRHTGLPLALLINFGTPLLKNGIKRFIPPRHGTD